MTEKNKNCLDCLHCKLIQRHKELRCKAGLWEKANGEEKFIKLIVQESRTLDIRSRDIFHLALHCVQFVPVGD